MKEYPKIETLLDRDEKTFKVIPGKWRTPEFEYLATNLWTFTEKVDGTNIRVMWNGRTVGLLGHPVLTFGGKTNDAQIPPFLLKRLGELFAAELMVKTFPDSIGSIICLYGEGYGARIQKGGGLYKSDGVDFVLFDVWIDGWWLERKNVEDVASKLDVKCVPIVREGTLLDAIRIVQSGFTSTWGDFKAEGLVVFPKTMLFTRKGARVIGKIKPKDF